MAAESIDDPSLQEIFHTVVVPALKDPDSKLIDELGAPMVMRAQSWTVRAREWALAQNVTRSTTLTQASSIASTAANGDDKQREEVANTWGSDPIGLKAAGGLSAISRTIRADLSAYQLALTTSHAVQEHFRQTRTSVFATLEPVVRSIPWGEMRKNPWFDRLERKTRENLHLPTLGIYAYGTMRTIAADMARSRILSVAQSTFHATHEQIKRLFEMEAVAQAHDQVLIDEKKAASDVGFRIEDTATTSTTATETAQSLMTGQKRSAVVLTTSKKQSFPIPGFDLPPGSATIWKLDETVASESETLARLASSNAFGDRAEDLKFAEQLTTRVNHARVKVVSCLEMLKTELMQMYQVESLRYKLNCRYSTYHSIQSYMARLLELSASMKLPLPKSLEKQINEVFIASYKQMEIAHDERKRTHDETVSQSSSKTKTQKESIAHWQPTIRAHIVWKQWTVLFDGLQKLKTPGVKKEMPTISARAQMQFICDGLRKDMIGFWSNLGDETMEDAKLAHHCTVVIHEWNQYILSQSKRLEAQCNHAISLRCQLTSLMSAGKPATNAISLVFQTASDVYALGAHSFPKHTSKLRCMDTLCATAADAHKLSHHTALEIALQLHARKQVKRFSA